MSQFFKETYSPDPKKYSEGYDNIQGKKKETIESPYHPSAREVWMYLESETSYKIEMTCGVKIKTGEWVPGVVYSNMGGMTFCRDIETFIKKFKLITSA